MVIMKDMVRVTALRECMRTMEGRGILYEATLEGNGNELTVVVDADKAHKMIGKSLVISVEMVDDTIS